jgi:MerR family copper efflux transcriptional regulator
MRISEAARRLGLSPRMLRYREDLGLLPVLRERVGGGSRGPTPVGGGSRGPIPVGGGSRGPIPVAGANDLLYPGQWRQRPGSGAGHRQFTDADLEAIRFVMSVERRFDVSPAALSFALRTLTEPAVRASVLEAGRRIGRLPVSAPVRALDFEKERALRALRRP